VTKIREFICLLRVAYPFEFLYHNPFYWISSQVGDKTRSERFKLLHHGDDRVLSYRIRINYLGDLRRRSHHRFFPAIPSPLFSWQRIECRIGNWELITSYIGLAGIICIGFDWIVLTTSTDEIMRGVLLHSAQMMFLTFE
jgi:hypothetical protein